MFHRSSTSSSERRARHRPGGRALWAALAVLLVARVVLGVGSDFFGRFRGAADDHHLRAAERQLTRRPAPRVVLFGSSRLKNLVRESDLAERLGLPVSAVANGAIDGGNPWDVLALLRRNPRLFDGAELFIHDIQFWQLNASFRRGIPRPSFYRYATLGERWAVRDLSARCLLVADWVWPFVSERRTLVDWVRGPRASVPRPVPVYSDRPHRWDPVPMASKHAGDFVFDQVAAGYWRSLVGELRRRHIPQVVLHLPARSAYVSWLRRHAAPAYADYLGFARSLEGPGVRLLVWDLPAEAGLSDLDFHDYGHATRAGARRFAAVLGRALSSLDLVPPPAEPPSRASG